MVLIGARLHPAPAFPDELDQPLDGLGGGEAGAEPQPAEPVAAVPAPVPPTESAPSATPVVSAEVVNQISGAITDAVKDAVTAPAPDPSPSTNPPPPPAATTNPPPHQSAGARMRAGVQAKKHARLEKIVALAAEKRVITNDDIENLLKVSDATATNYLRELVQAGRLRRSGVRAGTKYEVV